ncbi:response regulator [Pelolinea submarina]|uniref:LuxR family two component transcriptional regulator n=1 Tax=Pelolinea submarina TaxID=913107 RepID=A0A347ZRM1_9CHLR|nr:response regulator transcription factor [Pelolinea submarina]REG11492.1 LuxR family two component transcriptional regulator [Pelolinea submarina]BBB47952.1 two-component system response regulator [Pelolinea submarina]
MIKVILCDDQLIVIEGLRKIIESDPEIKVIGYANNGAELIELLANLDPDLILLDLKMPVMNGIIATRNIRRDFPNIHVLALTTYDDDEWVFDALQAGAEGYLLKDLPPDQLIQAIKGTMKGNAYIDPKVTKKVIKQARSTTDYIESPRDFDLTEREREILVLIAHGLSNADVAEQLFLSEGTIRNYTKSIFKKLEVTTRTQAAVLAIKYGLVKLDQI